jgi:glutamyl-tRNA reductase
MIGLIGINYKTASIEKRELFSFSKEEIVPFADLLQQETDISDMVLISTCNRTEIYFSQSKHDRLYATERVIETIKKFKKAEFECSRYFYHKFDLDAVKHLFTVASGIDSMIIGEDQVLAQIKEAYLYCTEAALTDAILMRLFQKSFETGKRARTETGIKLGNLSVSSTAVELCSQKLGSLAKKSVLIIGSGETGKLALQNFYKKGVGSITLMNRTLKNAEPIAKKYNANLKSLLSVTDELGKHDIILVATKAPNFVINEEMANVAQQKFQKPQVYIDLSVPRNIDHQILTIDQISLYAVDDLQKVISQNADKRAKAAEKAKAIIDQMAAEFSDWKTSRSLRPAIKTINNNLNEVYKQELETFRHFDNPKIKDAVDKYTRHMIQRYSRLLVRNLKELTDNGRNTDSLNIINELFSFEEKNRRRP